MKAWRLHEPGPFQKDRLKLETLEEPEPESGEVKIEVETCGMCHTDLHIIESDIEAGKLPLIPGHQVAGYACEINGEAERYTEGDRIGVPWLNWTCGNCKDCGNGNENLCKKARFTGCDTDGGFAEFMTAPLEFAHPVPEEIDSIHLAPLLCGGVVGYRALKLSEVTSGERLGLYGFGSSASMVIQAAIHRDCECYVFTRSEKHMELAEELGAVWTGKAEEDPGVKMHSSILFAPAGRLVLEALDQLRQGGTLSIAGIYLSPIPEMDYEQYLYRERTVRSVTASTRKDVRELLDLAAEIPIGTQTEEFPFDKLPEGLERMKKSKHNASPVLLISG